MAARKKYKVDYPLMYSTESTKEATSFNCVQRGHQNALESMPLVVELALVGGLKHPLLAAAAVAIWCAGRVGYMIGYSTGDPSKRYSRVGFLHIVGQVILLGVAVSFGLSLLGFI
eukprot:TRINITY_DN122549_c0_g1_i2.p1 TRINITY_DN122549_c0_g1~~TRINITY_DN122549_c0_g1_i2.p1  ORF type:complete len:115 (-),score=28.05 TRINITY_DN122549_c0_g1_i2:56-400(-)